MHCSKEGLAWVQSGPRVHRPVQRMDFISVSLLYVDSTECSPCCVLRTFLIQILLLNFSIFTLETSWGHDVEIIDWTKKCILLKYYMPEKTRWNLLDRSHIQDWNLQLLVSCQHFPKCGGARNTWSMNLKPCNLNQCGYHLNNDGHKQQSSSDVQQVEE